MAKTYGITISSRRSYRPIPEGPAMLPQLPQRVSNNKKGPKTSEIINAVNKEKWTFLQRLLAIEEKHEQKKLARQKEQMSKKPEEHEEDQENNPATNGRWIYDQILDDDADDDCNPDLIDSPSKENNRDSDTNRSLFVSSSPSIKQITRSHHELDSTNPYFSDASSSSTHAHQKEDSLMSRTKRKRPLRLPPILLPPLYTVRPRPLQEREFLTPTRIRGPITDEEWEDLYNCRYIRHATPKYALQLSPSQSSFYF